MARVVHTKASSLAGLPAHVRTPAPVQDDGVPSVPAGLPEFPTAA